MISKYGPSLSKAVDPSFLVVKKSQFDKNIHLTASPPTPQNRKYMKVVVNTVKPVSSSHYKKDETKILITTHGSLMKVERIAECSP